LKAKRVRGSMLGDADIRIADGLGGTGIHPTCHDGEVMIRWERPRERSL
jgi:hypothetical protein